MTPLGDAGAAVARNLLTGRQRAWISRQVPGVSASDRRGRHPRVSSVSFCSSHTGSRWIPARTIIHCSDLNSSGTAVANAVVPGNSKMIPMRFELFMPLKLYQP